jgi:hypothetical protein
MCSIIFALLTAFPYALAQQKTTAACRDEWRANKAANQTAGITEKAYVAQCRAEAAPARTNAAPPAPPPPAPNVAGPATGQKTAAACRDEWRANRAANQAAGITEKAYVAQCRAGTAPARTTAAPPAPPPPAPNVSGPATGQKTAAACRDEWRANKAANQAAGITEKAYVAQCRAGAAPARTTAVAPAPPPPAPARPPAQAPNQTGANEFPTEAQAKTRCPTDTVVWANLPTRVYHFNDTRYYGNTQRGAYMCEHDALAAGMRAAKNETHP